MVFGIATYDFSVSYLLQPSGTRCFLVIVCLHAIGPVFLFVQSSAVQCILRLAARFVRVRRACGLYFLR